MEKPTIYVETSVISYLTARPSTDPGIAGRQHETHVWWDSRRDHFRLVTSRLVIEEASKGDPQAAAERLHVLGGLDLLDFEDEEAASIVNLLVASGPLPAKATDDATHVAIAVLNGADYLLTWNCTHLANATLRRKVEVILRDAGYRPVIMCTPWDLMDVPGPADDG